MSARRFLRRSLVAILICCLTRLAAADTPFWGPIDLLHAELFGVDNAHSYLGFTVGFLGMTRTRGTFKTYNAVILYDEKNPANSSVTVVIDPASIDTGSEFRDKDLKSDRFFDVAHHPRIQFQSRTIERTGKDRYRVTGTLEIRGVRREISFPMEQTVPRGPDNAWGNLRIGGSGHATVKRSDFGLLGNEFWGKAIGEEVEIEIDLLGMRSNFDRWGFDSTKKPSIGEAMWKTVGENGVDAAIAQYREIVERRTADYNLAPGQIAIVANRLLQRGRWKEGLEIEKLASEAAPGEASYHGRLGETYARLGDRAASIAEYRKALELDPGNAEAIEMLRRLEPTPGK